MAETEPAANGFQDAPKRPEPFREEIRALQVELSQSQRIIQQLREELSEQRRNATDGETSMSSVARLTQELDRNMGAIEQQHEVARELQSLFMPPILPECDGVRFAVKYKPSSKSGGELYDVFDMGNSCVGILVADIAGHGLSATLASAVTKMAFDTFRQNEYSPKAIMEKANRQIIGHTHESHFITAFLGVLDLETRRMKFVNACHPCPIVCSGKRFDLLDAPGLCCGMFDEPRYEEGEAQLEVGDHVLFYTRGLVTSANAQGEAYENARLFERVRSSGEVEIGALLDLVTKDFFAHVGSEFPTEDLILVGLETLPREAVEERIVIPSDPQQLSRIESAVLARLEAENYGERTYFGVRLALEEAIVNAIKHGNRMDKAKKVTVIHSVNQERCIISVKDQGCGFDPDDVPDPTADENIAKTSGRGLMLMRAYMDDVQYSEQGTKVTMTKKAPWAS